MTDTVTTQTTRRLEVVLKAMDRTRAMRPRMATLAMPTLVRVLAHEGLESQVADGKEGGTKLSRRAGSLPLAAQTPAPILDHHREMKRSVRR